MPPKCSALLTLALCCKLVSADRATVNETLSQNCPAWGQEYAQMDALLARFKIASVAPRVSTPAAVKGPIHVAFTVVQSAKDQRFPTGPFHDLRVAAISLLLSTDERVAFHVVTNREWFAMLENFFTELAASVLNCCFTLYCVDMASMAPHMATLNISAPPALWTRVLLPDILTGVDDVIYLDTDLFFVSDIAELWAVRATMPANVAMAATPTGLDGVGRYCSCVMVLRLSLLRKIGTGGYMAGFPGFSVSHSTWLQTVERVVHNSDEFKQRKKDGSLHSIIFVEQKVYSWVGIAHKLVQPLPAAWNVEQCKISNRRFPVVGGSLGIVHFNCMETSKEGGKFSIVDSSTIARNDIVQHPIGAEQTSTWNSYARFYGFYQSLPIDCLRKHLLSVVPNFRQHDGIPNLAHAVCGRGKDALGCRPYSPA